MLGPDRCEIHKKHTGTRYAELVLLHLVGSAGHVVQSGATEVLNDDALFFMLRCDRYRFPKKRTGKRCA
jgi:hypothetical protein